MKCLIFTLVFAPAVHADGCSDRSHLMKERDYWAGTINLANGRIRSLLPKISDKEKILNANQKHIQTLELQISEAKLSVTQIEDLINQKHILDSLLGEEAAVRKALADDIESEINASADAPSAEKIVAAVNTRPIRPNIQTAFARYVKNLKVIGETKTGITYRAYLQLFLSSLQAETPAEIRVASHSVNILLLDVRRNIIKHIQTSQQQRETIQRDLELAQSNLETVNAEQRENHRLVSLGTVKLGYFVDLIQSAVCPRSTIGGFNPIL